ncbi:MAG: hypothetical protein MJ016_03000 [Victivallaceae bacterium]|nr:hypothetical protein [Victivallaceae bacterium]
MTIAVSTQWGENFARFACFRIDAGKMREEEEVPVPPGGADALIRQLIGLEVDLLIAAKMSEELQFRLRESGINVISGVEGRAASVMAAYLRGELDY